MKIREDGKNQDEDDFTRSITNPSSCPTATRVWSGFQAMSDLLRLRSVT
jgi:hypothetical protein